MIGLYMRKIDVFLQIQVLAKVQDITIHGWPNQEKKKN